MKLAMPKFAESANFWRSVSLILISFIAGNAVAFLSFGLGRASKADLARMIAQQNATNAKLADGIDGLNKNMAELVGYLKGKQIIGGDGAP